ncbi:MAG: hypothetical protein Q8P03_00790 [bacterium]|nr:hypothetical protein [bacterium]
MPSRKLFDIAPPRKAQKEEPRRESPKLRKVSPVKRRVALSSKKLLWGSIGLFGVVLLAALQTFLASAAVLVQPVMREVAFQETVIADPGVGTVSPDKKAIPGHMAEQEKSGTKFFEATGKKAQETRAKGTIRVFNNQAKTQILVATTRFISEEGKLFRSTSRITIAPNGYTDVGVVAAEAGAEYNIGASNFSLPGLLGSALYTVVYGKSFTAMQGGMKSEVTVVSEDDIRGAKEAYIAELVNSAKEGLKNTSSPLTLLEESLREEVVKMSSSVEAGAGVARFNVTGTVKVRGLAFSESDLTNIAKELILLKKESKEAFDERTVTVTQESASFSASTQKAALELAISGEVYHAIDREEVRGKLLGKSKAEAQQLLLNYPGIEKFEFSFFPFWKQTVPHASSKLYFELVLPGD